MNASVKVKLVLLLFVATAIVAVVGLPTLGIGSVSAVCGTVTFQDANRNALNSNPIIYKPMHIRIINCNGQGVSQAVLRITPSDTNIAPFNVDMDGSSTQTSVNTFQLDMPQGSTFKYELVGPTGNVIHVATASLERNTEAGKLPDVDQPGGISDNLSSRTFTGGCCVNDSQCKGAFGQASSCTGAYSGLCQSGRLCAGGTRLFEGDTCSSGQQEGICATSLKCVATQAGGKCLSPCAALGSPQERYSCMTGRYSFDLASDQCQDVSPDCDCSPDLFIGSYESAFGGGDNSQSSCAIQSDDSVLSGTLFFADPSQQCNPGETSCAGIVPTITSATNPVSATVQVGCLPPGSYTLVAGATDGVDLTTVYGQQSFTVSSGNVTVPVSLGVLSMQQGKATFRVLDSSNEVKCVRNIDSVPGIGTPPAPPVEDPGFVDSSDQFGIRNCPYADEYEAGKVRFKPSDGVREGTAEYDRQYEEFGYCLTCVSADKGQWTALGCIVTTPEGIFTSLIRIGLGVMGGVALLRMIWLGIMIGRSEDEGKIQEGWKGIYATLGGIAVVIFSVLILRIIAVNILNVVPPGFFGI